jgi:NADPH:quinone reductase-like Zn-dependent oxidoreductase
MAQGRHGEEDVMRAISQDAYGSADALRLTETDKPAIAANEVLVGVRAAGVDRGTGHLLAGQPYLMRIIGFGFSRLKQRVPGLDVAGTVVAVGSGVTRFRPGDEVFGVALSPSTRPPERTSSSTNPPGSASSRLRSLQSPG